MPNTTPMTVPAIAPLDMPLDPEKAPVAAPDAPGPEAVGMVPAMGVVAFSGFLGPGTLSSARGWGLNLRLPQLDAAKLAWIPRYPSFWIDLSRSLHKAVCVQRPTGTTDNAKQYCTLALSCWLSRCRKAGGDPSTSDVVHTPRLALV